MTQGAVEHTNGITGGSNVGNAHVPYTTKIGSPWIGMTNNLEQIVIEHYLQRSQKTSSTGKYHGYYLFYFDKHQYVNNATSPQGKVFRKRGRSHELH